MIFSSLYSLIWFIHKESVYNKHITLSVISVKTWALIREYYDMLFRYIDDSWKLVWDKGGYRDVINAKIAKDQTDDQNNGFRSFEQ